MKKKIIMKSGKEKTFEEGFSEFIRSCKVKNLSEKTLEYYEGCMSLFNTFLESVNALYIKELNISLIDGFTLFLKDTGRLKDVSVNTNLRAIRAIVYYFQKLGYCEKFSIYMIKVNKEEKTTYSENELKILLKCPDTSQFHEYRNWVIINFLLATGCRVGELVGIQIKDIYFTDAIVKIKRGKSRRERHVPLSHTITKILIEYLEIRQHESDTDFLFPNAFGLKITSGSLKQAIAKYNKARGILKTSIHLFRHTFAKMWILSGGDIFRLQKILGHSSLDTVREYVNMFSDDLKRDFNSFNPLESLSSNKKYIKV